MESQIIPLETAKASFIDDITVTDGFFLLLLYMFKCY